MRRLRFTCGMCDGEAVHRQLADVRVPNNMRGLFEGGDPSLNLARRAFEYVQQSGRQTVGADGETIFRRLVP